MTTTTLTTIATNPANQAPQPVCTVTELAAQLQTRLVARQGRAAFNRQMAEFERQLSPVRLGLAADCDLASLCAEERVLRQSYTVLSQLALEKWPRANYRDLAIIWLAAHDFGDQPWPWLEQELAAIRRLTLAEQKVA